MNNQDLRLLSWVVLSLFLAGCTAFQLRDANEQLTSYYSAKQQAARDDDYFMQESVKSSLRKLAVDSAEQAQKEKNVLNRIAFYRIAGTAAWQAGDASVVSYAAEGSRLCGDGNRNRAPRDCGMLRVIPVFAGIDDTTETFDRLQAKVTATPADQRASYAPDARKVFDAYRDGFVSMVNLRPEIADSSAHPNLLKALDQNAGTLLCTLVETNALGLIATVDGDFQKAECEVYALKAQAYEAGVDRIFFPCLPERRAQLSKPPGCP